MECRVSVEMGSTDRANLTPLYHLSPPGHEGNNVPCSDRSGWIPTTPDKSQCAKASCRTSEREQWRWRWCGIRPLDPLARFWWPAQSTNSRRSFPLKLWRPHDLAIFSRISPPTRSMHAQLSSSLPKQAQDPLGLRATAEQREREHGPPSHGVLYGP